MGSGERKPALHYEERGEGQPILLLHGYASNAQVNWVGTGWAALLAEHGFRAVMPDLLGHGQSPKSSAPDDYRPDLLAEGILRLITNIHPGPWQLMGYSMGSWIGAHVVSRAPGQFACAVLGGIGDKMIGLERDREGVAAAMLAPAVDEIRDPTHREMRRFAQQLHNDLPSLAACIRGVYAPAPLPLERADLPLLFVVAEHDAMAGRPTNLSRKAPRAETVLVAGEDHLTAMMSAEYKTKVLDFLAQHRTVA